MPWRGAWSGRCTGCRTIKTHRSRRRPINRRRPRTDQPGCAGRNGGESIKDAGAIVFADQRAGAATSDPDNAISHHHNPWIRERTGGSSAPAAAVRRDTLRDRDHIAGRSEPRAAAHLWPQASVLPWSAGGYLDHVGGKPDADINVFGPLGGAQTTSSCSWRLPGPSLSATRMRSSCAPRRREGGSTRWRLARGDRRPVDANTSRSCQRRRPIADAAPLDDAHPPVEFQDQLAAFNTLITAAISRACAHIAEAMGGRHLACSDAERRAA